MQRHHVTLFHACSNRKQYRWFSLPTVAYQMQCVHINQCVRNALKYQSHVFWDTRQLMGPWQSHTGRMGLATSALNAQDIDTRLGNEHV